MIYKNIEIHNVGELLPGEQEGSTKWIRVPKNVYDAMECEQGKSMCLGSTGVELRFVMESDTITLRMRTCGKNGIFHVYRGSIQGGWEDHEVDKIVSGTVEDFVIKKSGNLPVLQRITDEFGYPFSPEVVCVIFDRGDFELLDVIGKVRPPKAEELPQKTLLAYGSSITHGSNSLDMSHSWVSVIAHNLKMDCRNLGMAGSCLMEPEIIDYIAREGELGNWDVALLELGANALGWEVDKIRERVSNVLSQIAGRNLNKKIFVISPFYTMEDYHGSGNPDKWRTQIEKIVRETNYPNVTYINGTDLLGDMSLVSADEIHPNIDGVAQIADRLTNKIQEVLISQTERTLQL